MSRLKIVSRLKEFAKESYFLTPFVAECTIPSNVNQSRISRRAIVNRSNNLQDWTRSFYLETEADVSRSTQSTHRLVFLPPQRRYEIVRTITLSCPVPFPRIKERTGGDNQRFLHDLYIPDGTFFSSLVREDVLHGPWWPCNFSISAKPVVSSTTLSSHYATWVGSALKFCTQPPSTLLPLLERVIGYRNLVILGRLEGSYKMSRRVSKRD